MPVDESTNRIALFAQLASFWNGRSSSLGRTAIMKLCFFLQEAFEVPLGYDFTLYSYGPFDSEVLVDIQRSENFKVLNSKLLQYSGGYGFEYRPGAEAPLAIELGRDFLTSYAPQITKAINLFGGRSGSDLELYSTIFYVWKVEQTKDPNELLKRVAVIKPRFSSENIRRSMDSLIASGLLKEDSIRQ